MNLLWKNMSYNIREDKQKSYLAKYQRKIWWSKVNTSIEKIQTYTSCVTIEKNKNYFFKKSKKSKKSH